MGDDGTFIGYLQNNTEGGTRLATGVKINDGQWHHLVMSVNDITKTVTFYVDGKLVATDPYTKSLGYFDSSHNFGNSNYSLGTGTGYGVPGIVDDAMIIAAPME